MNDDLHVDRESAPLDTSHWNVKGFAAKDAGGDLVVEVSSAALQAAATRADAQSRIPPWQSTHIDCIEEAARMHVYRKGVPGNRIVRLEMDDFE